MNVESEGGPWSQIDELGIAGKTCSYTGTGHRNRNQGLGPLRNGNAVALLEKGKGDRVASVKELGADVSREFEMGEKE
ncbi:MAG: hypothetical protein JRJ03_06270 [Deltaproteobacteria bacterium]|nr:hypothetical protein [Deltaproteobacteria bacterium]